MSLAVDRDEGRTNIHRVTFESLMQVWTGMRIWFETRAESGPSRTFYCQPPPPSHRFREPSKPVRPCVRHLSNSIEYMHDTLVSAHIRYPFLYSVSTLIHPIHSAENPRIAAGNETFHSPLPQRTAVVSPKTNSVFHSFPASESPTPSRCLFQCFSSRSPWDVGSVPDRPKEKRPPSVAFRRVCV